MIVCSCAAITDHDIEQALVEILSLPEAPLPTPGVVYRQLRKKMVCCGCSPVAVSTIYEKIDQLAAKGVVCPYACACAQGRLLRCAGDSPAQRLIEGTPPRPWRTEIPLEAGSGPAQETA
jgi:BFD-like [2Fe-2S] binding domain